MMWRPCPPTRPAAAATLIETLCVCVRPSLQQLKEVEQTS